VFCNIGRIGIEPCIPCGDAAIGQVGNHVAGQAPGYIFGEMPVKDVDFESGENGDLFFQLFDRDKIAAHIVHEPPDLKGGEINNFAAGDLAVVIGAINQLGECGFGPEQSDFRCGFNADCIRCYIDAIALLWVQVNAFDIIYNTEGESIILIWIGVSDGKVSGAQLHILWQG
jgi:hypothetical protein